MKYLYKSPNIEVDAVRLDGDNAGEASNLDGVISIGCNDDTLMVFIDNEENPVPIGNWVVSHPMYGPMSLPHEDFLEKFEPVRKMRVVRKNNKKLLERRGKGFWGRVLVVQFGDNYLVLQNKRGAGRDTAVMTYRDFEPTENEIYRLRQLYLKKYKSELGKLISFDQFCGSVQNGQQFYRDFEPVSKQTRLEL